MTYTKLILGTPKFKRRIQYAPEVYILGPCVEPYTTGANILIDPGFENHITNTGGGPQGDEIPGKTICIGGVITSDDHSIRFTDGSSPPDPRGASVSGWRSIRNHMTCGSLPINRWLVSTTNPRTGTYHLRSSPITGAGTSATGNPLNFYPVGVHTCTNGAAQSYFSCRADPGDTVTYSIYASVTAVVGDTIDPHVVNFNISFYNSAGTFISTSAHPSLPILLTTSYAQISHNAVAPANTAYADIGIQVDREPAEPPDAVAINFDFDDAVLAIT